MCCIRNSYRLGRLAHANTDHVVNASVGNFGGSDEAPSGRPEHTALVGLVFRLCGLIVASGVL